VHGVDHVGPGIDDLHVALDTLEIQLRFQILTILVD
jgi:hypothetical protein